MTDSQTVTHALQPLLDDAVIALRSPTQVWSARSGDLGSAPIHGIYHGDVRHVRGLTLACEHGAPEWISVAPRTASNVVFGGLLRGVDDHSPDPKVRILRDRTVEDGRVREALTIRSHVDHAVTVELGLRLSPDFAPLQEVKAGTVTASRVARRDRRR